MPEQQTSMEDLLEVIADHADRIAEGDGLADRDSLRTAQAIAELKATDWVTEYEAIKPAKPDALGVVKKDSDRRFTEWLAWREEKNHRRSLQARYINYLSAAEKIAARAHPVRTATEKTIRPLGWMLGTTYEQRMAEVWQTALEMAEAEGRPVDQSHVRAAVTAFKKTLGNKGVRAVISTKKAARDRARAQLYVQQLFSDGDTDEVKKFDAWYRGFRLEHAK